MGLSREFFYRFLLSPRAGSLVKTIARISIVGVWLGVTALILIMSVMNGFNRSIRKRLVNVEPHLVVTFDEDLSEKQIRKHQIFNEATSREDMVVDIFSTQDVILRMAEGKIQGAIARGISKASMARLFRYAEEKAGRDSDWVEEGVQQMKPGEVVVGFSLAESSGLFEGDTLTIIPPENLIMSSGQPPVLTRGVVKNFIVADLEVIDRHTLFYLREDSFPRLRATAGLVRGMEVRLSDPNTMNYWKDQWTMKGTTVQTWKDRNASLFFALKVEKIVIAVLVGMSTLIAGLSIISVLVLLVTQKKRDIGHFMAMGMTRNDVKKLFLHIGIFLSLTGVFVGAFSGVGLSFLVDRFSQDLLPHFYEETNIPAEIQWVQVGAILLFAPIFNFVTLSWTLKRISHKIV